MAVLWQVRHQARPWRTDICTARNSGFRWSSTTYGMGEDTLWTGNVPLGRSRFHSDNSVEIKYYDQPTKFLDKMAFSLTGDLGCEYGGGVSCHHNEPLVTAANGSPKGGPKQSFAGWMLYNRWWFDKDKYAITVGGGAFDNPGRYLTLLQPINGADAVSGTPYFPEGPGLPFKAWDTLSHFRLHAQAVHHVPLGVRLSPRRRAVLYRPRRYHASRAEITGAPANLSAWTTRPRALL